MTYEDVRERAFCYHNSDFNCAEAVFRSIVEIVNDSEAKEMTKIASPFVQGVGGTREELCGALAGGIMAIGYLMGRTEPGVDIGQAKDVASMLRSGFIEKYGTTKCQSVLDMLGPQENSMKCKELTGGLAGDLYLLLKENGYII